MNANVAFRAAAGEAVGPKKALTALTAGGERATGKTGAFEQMVRGRHGPFPTRVAADALARPAEETESEVLPESAQAEEDAPPTAPGLRHPAAHLFTKDHPFTSPAKVSDDAPDASGQDHKKHAESRTGESAAPALPVMNEAAAGADPLDAPAPAHEAPEREKPAGAIEAAAPALPPAMPAAPAEAAGKSGGSGTGSPTPSVAAVPAEAKPQASDIGGDLLPGDGGRQQDEQDAPAHSAPCRTQATEKSDRPEQRQAAEAEPTPAKPAATVVSQQSIPAPALSPAGPAATVLAPVLAAAQAAGAPSAVFETLAQTPRPQAMQTLSIQLTPVELGTVEAKLRVTGAELSVELRVETHEAWRRLSSDHDEIVKALRDKGYDIGQVTILPPQASAQPASRADSGFGAPAFGRDQQMPSQGGGNSQPGGGQPGSGQQTENGRNEGTDERATQESRMGLSGGLYI